MIGYYWNLGKVLTILMLAFLYLKIKIIKGKSMKNFPYLKFPHYHFNT